MLNKDDDFLKRLRVTFMAEAEDHIKALTAGLLELEKTPSSDRQESLLDNIFREAHSLKGAARSVNIADIEDICQIMESIFFGLRKGSVDKSQMLFDTLHQAVDTVEKIINLPEGDAGISVSKLIGLLRSLAGGGREAGGRQELAVAPGPPADKGTATSQAAHIASEAGKQKNRKSVKESPAEAPGAGGSLMKPAQTDTVRIAVAKLDSLMRQAEELVSLKATAAQRLSEIKEIAEFARAREKETAAAVSGIVSCARSAGVGHQDGPTARKLAAFSGSLKLGLRHVKGLDSRLQGILKSARRDCETMNVMIDSLVEDMKKAVMLPFSSILEGLPKMVREISRDGDKKVELSISGSEIEIDKRILQELKDPLIHILRNCVDHGIESPADRAKAGKPEQGNIRIGIIQRDSSRIEVLITDDGAGIDIGKVRQAAAERGALREEDLAVLEDHEVLGLIFRTELSTSRIVTTLSGRGLGLAIVKERVELLGGTVTVNTTPRLGTTFRLLMPITLATFRGIIVSVSGQLFVVPTTNVERAVRVARKEIKTVENRDTILLDGRAYSLVRMSAVLELGGRERPEETSGFISILLLGTRDSQIAFAVDDILGEQEILLKKLGGRLIRVRNVAGAAVLGSGKPAVVLNVTDLLKSSVKAGAAVLAAGRDPGGHAVRRKSVLVAEDSITARTLFKNILESAGYIVRTAVDGQDALTALKEETFDLVVSDVQMPRMNGFELTERIRADAGLASIPVVLITGLEAREDKERGIDVGADAYIVKSSFDQGNLLEVVSRLI
jgi:two-component system chemotaxis sensor kinase CheA